MSTFPAVKVVPRHEVVPAPASPGRHSYFTSNGDQLSPLVRAGGPALELTLAGADDDEVDFQFGEPVEIHDGQAFWGPDGVWDKSDRILFCMVCPATAAPAQASGNCDLVAVTGGNIIVPAPAIDGANQVTLSTAVPVMAQDANGNPSGYYNVDWDTGTITAVADPESPDGNSNLFDFEIVPKMIPGVSMGNPQRILDVDTYRIQHVHPNQKVRFKVIKGSADAGWAAAWLLVFREKTT